MDSPDPDVRTGVACDIVTLRSLGALPVIVHGGGKAINDVLKTAGKEMRIAGDRVTPESDIPLITAILDHHVNSEVAEHIEQDLGGAQQ